MRSRARSVVHGTSWRGDRDPASVSASTWANRPGQPGDGAGEPGKPREPGGADDFRGPGEPALPGDPVPPDEPCLSAEPGAAGPGSEEPGEAAGPRAAERGAAAGLPRPGEPGAPATAASAS